MELSSRDTEMAASAQRSTGLQERFRAEDVRHREEMEAERRSREQGELRCEERVRDTHERQRGEVSAMSERQRSEPLMSLPSPMQVAAIEERQGNELSRLREEHGVVCRELEAWCWERR